VTSWLTGFKVLFPSQNDVSKPREKSTEASQSTSINNRQEDRNKQVEINKKLSRAKLQEYLINQQVEINKRLNKSRAKLQEFVEKEILKEKLYQIA
jgi:hypothetical protein